MGKGWGRKAKPNEICPFCDSKKKYKKCCGSAAAKEKARTAPAAPANASGPPRTTMIHRSSNANVDESQRVYEDVNLTEMAINPEFVTVVDGMIKANDSEMDTSTREKLLLRASEAGNLELAKVLVDASVNVNTVDVQGCAGTPVHLAAQSGHVELVKLLLAAKAHVNHTEAGGWFPLFLSARQNHVEVVKVLIDAKADVNKRNAKEGGVTALHMVCGAGHLETAKVLLHHGANIEQRTADGITPLSVAALANKLPVVNALLDAKANPNDLNGRGLSTLEVAAHNGHMAVVKQLIKRGAVDAIITAPDGQLITRRLERWTEVQQNPELMAFLARRRCGGCQGLFGKGETNPCAGCKQISYCSRECQKKDWADGHKQVCEKVKAGRKGKR